MPRFARTLLFALIAFVGLATPTMAQRPENLPDIDVIYIERTPRYPGYRPDYDLPGWKGVPVLVDQKTRKPLTPAQVASVKRWPSPGERVTFTAHVQNRGNAPAPAWEYAWYLDGKEVVRGSIKERQRVGYEVTVEAHWQWQPGRHTVKFVADPLHKVRDLSLHNNHREDATDAWSLIWAVDRVTYESFLKSRNFLGTKSFEDWAQWHIDHMNHLFDASPTPWGKAEGKRGSGGERAKGPLDRTSVSGPPAPAWRPRVRCDKIVVVDNVEGVWDRELGQGVQPLDAGYDGAWSFGRREDCAEWAANVDWGLIHEWGHQLGLTDLYALDRPGYLNEVADENGDPLLIGHLSSMAGFMMHGHGPTTFSPECMGALMTQQGRRRGYYGDYYFSIPARNYLRVLDNQGKPVPSAKVAFWQDKESKYSGSPVFTGTTDKDGLFLLPNRPAPHMTTALGYTQRDNPFGQINVVGSGDVFFVRIQARGHTEYTWMDIPELNLAYWRGERERAVYTRATRIPPAGVLHAPQGLKADVTRDQLRLTWQPVPGAKSYRVYHGAPELYQYKPVVEMSSTVYEGTLGNGALHRFVVTAISPDDRESGFSTIAGAMHFVKPWGIVVTKQGNRLIRDSQYGQAVLQKADGNTVGLVGSVHYHFNGSYDIALDSKGRLLSAKWGDGYDPNPGFRVQDPALNLVVDHRQPEGSGTGQFSRPMGIAANSKDHIFVADTGNDRVQEFTPDGTFVRVIGEGELLTPMKVAFDKQDRLYVADSVRNRIAVFTPDASGVYRLTGSLTDGIKEPVYVAVDDRGRVFVSTNRVAGVYMFGPDGKVAWGYKGTDLEPIATPRGLAFDGKGNLLIVDESSRRVYTVKLPP
jgi:DNA-binding beta-propeller fold protein YncE